MSKWNLLERSGPSLMKKKYEENFTFYAAALQTKVLQNSEANYKIKACEVVKIQFENPATGKPASKTVNVGNAVKNFAKRKAHNNHACSNFDKMIVNHQEKGMLTKDVVRTSGITSHATEEKGQDYGWTTETIITVVKKYTKLLMDLNQ